MKYYSKKSLDFSILNSDAGDEEMLVGMMLGIGDGLIHIGAYGVKTSYIPARLLPKTNTSLGLRLVIKSHEDSSTFITVRGDDHGKHARLHGLSSIRMAHDIQAGISHPCLCSGLWCI